MLRFSFLSGGRRFKCRPALHLPLQVRRKLLQRVHRLRRSGTNAMVFNQGNITIILTSTFNLILVHLYCLHWLRPSVRHWLRPCFSYLADLMMAGRRNWDPHRRRWILGPLLQELPRSGPGIGRTRPGRRGGQASGGAKGCCTLDPRQPFS